MTDLLTEDRPRLTAPTAGAGPSDAPAPPRRRVSIDVTAAAVAKIVAGLLLVLWAPRLVLPRGLPALLSPLAAASLAIYLTHWVVYPPLDADHDVLAALLSLAVGVAVWKVAVFAVARARPLSVAVPRLRALVPTRPEALRAVSPTRRRSSRRQSRQGLGQPCEAP